MLDHLIEIISRAASPAFAAVTIIVAILNFVYTRRSVRELTKIRLEENVKPKDAHPPEIHTTTIPKDDRTPGSIRHDREHAISGIAIGVRGREIDTTSIV